MRLPRPIEHFWKKLRVTGKRFMEIDPLKEASSLSYTTIFAIPGVFIVTLTVASFFWDPEEVQNGLYEQAGGMLGSSTIEDLKEMVASASEQKSGVFARIMGVLALVLSATTAFVALQTSLNKVWRVEATPGRAIVRYLLSRLISLGLIAAFGFLLLVSLILEALLVKTSDQMGSFMPDSAILATIAGFIASFAVVTLVFASVFKFLPDVKVPWRYVWIGALFTSVMFSLGKYLIGLYISKSGAGDAFGAGGAVIIIMLWVYYSAILLLFGAQYTQVSAEEGHARVQPTRQARRVGSSQKKATSEEDGA